MDGGTSTSSGASASSASTCACGMSAESQSSGRQRIRGGGPTAERAGVAAPLAPGLPDGGCHGSVGLRPAAPPRGRGPRRAVAGVPLANRGLDSYTYAILYYEYRGRTRSQARRVSA